MINYRPLEQVKAEDFESAPELQEYTYRVLLSNHEKLSEQWSDSSNDFLPNIAYEMIETQARKMCSFWLWYVSNCCNAPEVFLLDRRVHDDPYSIAKCSSCCDWAEHKVKEPISVHFPLKGRDYTLNELKKELVIMEDHWQSSYLKALLEQS